MKKIKKISVSLMFTLLFAALLTTGCDEKNKEHASNKQQVPPNQTIPSFVADTSKKDSKSEVVSQNIVRKGVIDLASIDQNKDGKVFECQMDYNVISDKAGICPECKMDLEEVTLQKAKENLKANKLQVK